MPSAEVGLAEAIRLRESGKHEEARALLLELHEANPTDPLVNYQCAWIHDKLGLEREAVPFYAAAIENGLSGDDLRGALLGLGSTYRAIGDYEKATETLSRGRDEFPDAAEFPVFLAMAYYNLGAHADAVGILLKTLVKTSDAEGVARFREALLFYADRLDETW